ncbi:HTH_Tnp_Tc3_2 domain-containing protein [Trichonephila clavipes]|nr:HTH_Tnp_Tc3_2 domain-containing protein [Trichonephila clavipes]
MTIPDFSPTKNVYTPQQWSSNCVPRNSGVPVPWYPSGTVSKRIVQRSLRRMGFRNRQPTRVPLLTARHWAASLTCARDHRDWSVEDCKRVAWSDVSRFRLLNADGRLRIWRQAHEAIDPAC